MLWRGDPGIGEPGCKHSCDDHDYDDCDDYDNGDDYDDYDDHDPAKVGKTSRPHPQSLLSLGLRRMRGRGCPS